MRKKSRSENVYKIGQYEILLDRKIGAGNNSIVYIGRRVDDTEKIIAIKKIILKNLSNTYQKKVTDEIQIMQHIKNNPHINIVTCYDVIDDLDTVYIIMEYCDGGDFSKLIGKPMKEENVKYYFRQLINGIKYLNDFGIIHRDIKPKNLLLTNDKQVLKICDFGLAKNKMGLSRIYTICGSPLYMAPEMFKDKSYNDNADLWSIGIILYEMLYGKNPLSQVRDYHELELFMNDNEDINILPNEDTSEECFDLLRMLLTKDNEKRITLNELYVHKWLFPDKLVECTDNNGEINKMDDNHDTILFKFEQ